MINQLKKKQPKFKFRDVLKKTQKDILDIEKPKQQSKENTLEEIKNIMLDLVQYFTNQNRQSDNIFQFRKTLDDTNIIDQYEQRSYQQQVRSQLAHQLQKAGQTYTQQQFQEITNAIIQNNVTDLPIQFIESLNINNSVVNIQNQYIKKIDGDYQKLKQIGIQSKQQQQQLIKQIIQQMKNEEEKEQYEEEIQEKKVQKPQQQVIEQIVKKEYDKLDKKLKTLKKQQEQNYQNIDKKITTEDGLNRLRQQYNMQTLDLIKNTELSVTTQIKKQTRYEDFLEYKRQNEIYEQLKKQQEQELKQLKEKQQKEEQEKQQKEQQEEQEEQELKEKQQKLKQQQQQLKQRNIRPKSQERIKTTGAQYLKNKEDVIQHLKNKQFDSFIDQITNEDVLKLSDTFQGIFNEVFEFNKDGKYDFKQANYNIINSNITKLIKKIQEQQGKSKYMKDINSDYDLDTFQLNKVMNKLFEKYNENYEYLGTYGFQQPQLIDQLQDLKDDIKQGLNVCFIMNTKPISHKGEHWFSVYITNEGIYLFDSQKTDQQQIKFGQNLQKMLNLKLYYNNNIIQKKDSPYCGLFACLFILRMIQSNDFTYSSFQYDNQSCIQPQLKMMDNLIQ